MAKMSPCTLLRGKRTKKNPAELGFSETGRLAAGDQKIFHNTAGCQMGFYPARLPTAPGPNHFMVIRTAEFGRNGRTALGRLRVKQIVKAETAFPGQLFKFGANFRTFFTFTALNFFRKRVFQLTQLNKAHVTEFDTH